MEKPTVFLKIALNYIKIIIGIVDMGMDYVNNKNLRMVLDFIQVWDFIYAWVSNLDVKFFKA